MKASELIKELEKKIEKHGDLEVYYIFDWHDYDEDVISIVNHRDYPERFLIK